MRIALIVKSYLKRVLEKGGVEAKEEVTTEEENLNIEIISTAITVEKIGHIRFQYGDDLPMMKYLDDKVQENHLNYLVLDSTAGLHICKDQDMFDDLQFGNFSFMNVRNNSKKKMKNICRLDGHSLKKDLEGSKGGERTKKKASKTEKRVRLYCSELYEQNMYELDVLLYSMSAYSLGLTDKAPDSAGAAEGASPGLTGITIEKSVDFSYDELATATDDFSISNKIGQGGFGAVYYFSESRFVICNVDVKYEAASYFQTVVQKAAIKKMDLRQFLAELKALTHVDHLNLVRLIGYCVEGSLFLVYEYIENGNLSQNLRASGEVKAQEDPLTWSTRVQIALDSARGLEYIHKHTLPTYIDRDIKSANVLTDKSFNAKILVYRNFQKICIPVCLKDLVWVLSVTCLQNGDASQGLHPCKSSTTAVHEIYLGGANDIIILYRGMGCWLFLRKRISNVWKVDSD
ncbi:hypothetical protein M9H77_22219 [Catharanthus roseus]|uniref:Uncharacterized protein n=1 Tax=Catharanthus roseus TaxID=4058 RepID=A0ACC0ATV9_CATRO|nr:hypothetical protein M9H77_22219 [Catharanthus roseus]